MMTFAKINGLTLHYNLTGLNQGTPLVFINSLGTDLRIWDELIPYFAPQYRLIRYDKRGHGLSASPPAPYTLHNHTDDLAGLLDYLEVEGVILVGDSVGGMIALDFAALAPQRVKALVLCATGPKIGTTEMWDERINTLLQNGLEHLAEAILARWFSPGFAQQRPADYQDYYKMLTHTSLAGYVGTCAAIRDADLHPILPEINQPTLVLAGGEDQATPPDFVRELAKSLPSAWFAIIAGAGHIPSIEQPAQMAQLMSDFFKETS